MTRYEQSGPPSTGSELARQAAAITDFALRQPETATSGSSSSLRTQPEPPPQDYFTAPPDRGHKPKPTPEAAPPPVEPSPPKYSAADKQADPPPANADSGGSKPPKPPRHDTEGTALPDPDDAGGDKDSDPSNATPDFRGKIDAITSRRLSPENIETYAEDALDDLVDVVGEVTELYDQQHPADAPTSGADHERAALLHTGLDGDEIETTLDHIDSLAEELAALDTVITAITTQTDTVIIPPKETEVRITPGEEQYGPKQHIPRLKTLLFVLSNQFDIDLQGPEACSVSDGVITNSMMRQESYKLVVVPALNRSVLVCDEEGNVTFVFDTQRLTAANIDQDTLQGWTKENIKNFLASNPGAGYRLVYSKAFTEEITSLLEGIPTQDEAVHIDPDSGRLLEDRTQVADKYWTTTIARELGVTRDAVHRAASALKDTLGDVEKDKKSRPLYSAGQPAMIQAWLQENGYLADEATKDYYSVARMSKSLSVGDDTIHAAIHDLGENIGTVRRATAGSNHPLVYSPAQQDKIRAWLIQKEKIAGDKGRLPIREIATLSGLSVNTIRTIVTERVEELGSVDRFGLTLRQQEIILDILDRDGYLAQKAPEGYATLEELPAQLGYSKFATKNAVVATREKNGEPGDFMVGRGKIRRRGKAYSPVQQENMRAWLQANGYTPTGRTLGAAAANPDTVQTQPEPPAADQ